MMLVIGGRGSGKLEYVKGLGYAQGDIANACLDARPVVYNVQDMVKGEAEAAALLPLLLEKAVVVCCEVGSGVIPDTRAAREAREAVGRLCVLLAKSAERVVRLSAGIPMVIKEQK